MKHMIQPFGIDMHKNVLTDTKAVKHMHFMKLIKLIPSLTSHLFHHPLQNG